MIIRIYDELRDSWAVAIAQVTAVFTWLIGAAVWESAVAGSAVLGVRLVAGLLLPRDPWIPPLSTLTSDELEVARRVARDIELDDISQELRIKKAIVDRLYRSILKKLHFRDSWEIRGWLVSLGDMPMPARPSGLRRFLDSTFVKATLTAGGFIGLSWTLFQIYRTACPGLHELWPLLSLPPCPS